MKYLSLFLILFLGSIGFALKVEEYNAANLLYQNKITTISPENTKYYTNLKRYEAALLLNRSVELLKLESNQQHNCNFSDLEQILSQEDKNQIIQSCKNGIFKGTMGKFYPNAYITKAELIMTIARILSGDSTLELNDSYDILIKNGVVKNDDRLESKKVIYRTDFYMMLSRVLKLKGFILKTLPKSCAYEGEKVAENQSGYLSKCCNGLTLGFNNFKLENGVCSSFSISTGSIIGTCMDCGDGLCMGEENFCNCPRDCKK